MEDPIFRKLEKIAKVRPLSEKEHIAYNKSLKIYRDNYAIAKTERSEGYEEGIAEGIEEGVRKVALNMLKSGTNMEYIHNMTGLTIEEINKLKID